MKEDILDSQVAILEELQPDETGVRISNRGSAEDVEAEMLAWVKEQGLLK